MKVNLNQDWLFFKSHDAFSMVFSIPSDALKVDLPDDALFREPQKEDSINQGKTGFLDAQRYCYVKTLKDIDKSKNYYLEVEQIAPMGSIYVNGSLVKDVYSPYMSTLVEITDYLVEGQENRILIETKNINEISRYYVGAGICRDVYLHIKDDCMIKPQSLCCLCQSVDQDGAKINLDFSIINYQNASYKTIEIEIFDDNTVIFKDSFSLFIKRGEETICQSYYLKNVALWSHENPQLYQIKASVMDANCQDEECITTGFRQLELDYVHGLRVNHQEIKLRGACLHHDQGLLGSATYKDYEFYRVSQLKEAGFNAIRSSHNPISLALLSACDQLGMYVMDELSDVWSKSKSNLDIQLFFENHYQEMIEDMVQKDYSHPSVILYSMGNEISNFNTIKGFEMSKKISDYFKQKDASRYTTCGINGAFAVGDEMIKIASDLTGKDETYFQDGDINKFMSIMASQMDRLVKHPILGEVLEKAKPTMDILGYNYMTSRYQQDSLDNQRIMVGTETYPKQIAQNWQIITSLKQVIGDFTWTGWDYLGEVHHFPELINTAGDISFLGQRRSISYYRELVFDLKKQPYMAVRSPINSQKPRDFGPWKYTDALPIYDYQEGDQIQVEVYHCGDKVELYQNDQLIGKKEVELNDPYLSLFSIIYHQGKLEAISYKEGKEIGRVQLNTPGLFDHFDIRNYDFKQNDLLIIEIEAKDRSNYLYTKQLDQVKLNVKHGKVLAFASYKTLYNSGYQNEMITINQGRALAIIKIEDRECFEYEILFTN